MNKNIFLTLLIIALIVVFSCEEGRSTLTINCDECYFYEPDSFELETELTINSAYDSAYLEFFQGTVESGELSWEGPVFTPYFYHLVRVNEYYSVRATYHKNGETIIAIDGDKMVTRYITDACDSDCWIVKGRNLNVKLKFD